MPYTALCTIEGCDRLRRSAATGWCNVHFTRWQRNGDPHRLVRERSPASARRRLKDNSVVLPNGCWEFHASYTQRSGHRQMAYEGKTQLAHRVAWMLDHGPIPDGMVVRHRCGTPACVRPDHLRLGTPVENNRDQVAWNLAARELIRRHRAEFDALLAETEYQREALGKVAWPKLDVVERVG